MIDVKVFVQDNEVQRVLNMVEDRVNPAALMVFLDTTIDPYLRGRARQRFASEGDAASGKWAPLAEATQNIRDSQGYGATGPINHRTGALENYILNTDGTVQNIGIGAQLTLPGPTNDPLLASKFKTAQQGKKKPQTPARPVLALDLTDFTVINGSLLTYVLTGIR